MLIEEMRVLTDIEARRDTAYDSAYHPKLRGRIWRALEGTEYDAHGHPVPGFAFSNPFPWGDLNEGDECHLLIASALEEQLAHITADLLDDRELNVGEMPFRVTGAHPLDPDVGPFGTEGVLETATGVYAVTPDQYLDGDDSNDEYHTYWRPEHGMTAFFDYIETQLQAKHDRFLPDSVPGPKEVDAPLFEEYELLKTFALDVEVTQGVEQTLVLSKWRFPYRVRDDAHREHLNLALDVGLGGRTPLGFGFVNKATEGT